MSSPLRRSNSRSSPSRHTPNGFRRSQANGVHSPYRANLDSPSRLIEEFSKVYIDDEKAFRKRLDEQADEQERLHRQALEKSLKEHEEVRQSAERAREKLQFEIQRLKVQRAEEEQIALEREKLRTAEAEAAAKQRELEAVNRREEALQQAAQKQREVEEAQRRIDAQKQQEEEQKAKREAERLQQQEAEKKSREEAAAKERAAAEEAAKKAAQSVPSTTQPQQQTPTSAPQTNGTPLAPSRAAPTQTSAATVSAKSSNGVLVPTGILTPMEEREAEHRRYLDLHKQLKVMRNETLEQAKQIGLKNEVGDMRRELKKIMGQLNKVDKKANREAMVKVKDVLLKAARMQQIMVDITPYLVSVPPGKLQESGGNTGYPAVLLFLLNHFAKAIMSQLAQEVSRDTQAADPIGILAVTMFSAPDFLFNGHSLIDVLWAKYHKVCPVLFGIYGTERSVAGRARLGWRIDDGAEVSAQQHYDQMTGFAAGFGAITLRDFTKSKNKSPAPVHLFWTSLARIVSTPNNEQTPTHYVVLNAMLKHSVPRFIGFYGVAAIAALRMACVSFPSGGGPPGPSGKGSDSTVLAVQSLPHSWQRDLNLTL